MTTITVIRCKAPKDAFGLIELVEPATWEVVYRMGGMPCDAGGCTGPWCFRCEWADTEDQEWDEDD